MAERTTPSERFERLGAGIAEAKARLAERRNLEWAGIDDMLEALSKDVGEMGAEHDDDDAAHARLDELEGRLTEAHSRIDEAEERES